MLAIPGWTYKGRWWQRFQWRKRRAIELLHRVGIRDHKDIMRSYPYELTEGECQKVMIAIALANQPRLLIADEPTNAMESTTQAQIFRLLSRLNQNNNTTILLISHDLQTMSKWADRINVLYCGQTAESAPSEELITAPPLHPGADPRHARFRAFGAAQKQTQHAAGRYSVTRVSAGRLPSRSALPLLAEKMHANTTVGIDQKSLVCLPFPA